MHRYVYGVCMRGCGVSRADSARKAPGLRVSVMGITGLGTAELLKVMLLEVQGHKAGL